MFFKVAVVLFVVANVYVACRPQEELIVSRITPVASEVIRQRIFTSQEFTDLLDEIWQQVSSHYVNPQSEQTSQPIEDIGQPPISVPGQVQGEISTRIQYFSEENHRPVYVDTLRASIFSSEAFNNFINHIWEQVSAQYGAAQNATNGITENERTYGNYQTRQPNEGNRMIETLWIHNGRLFRTVDIESANHGFAVRNDHVQPSTVQATAYNPRTTTEDTADEQDSTTEQAQF